LFFRRPPSIFNPPIPLASPTSKPLQAQAAAFNAALLAWYRNHGRALPWRTAPSLYRTVVSEFMCQQTQISTALPYFERWMNALPDFKALANAEEARVLKLWEGLGYYSRARNLQKLAQKWVDAHPKPRSADEWRAYPGVGPYTAAAIASMAFGEPAAVVDGNVVRLLTRLTRDETAFADNGRAVKAVTPLANALIASAPGPGDHNQAMMELGATVCAKANPQCLLCPVSSFCEGRQQGDPARLPRLAKRNAKQRVVNRALVIRDAALLLHRIPSDARRLAGLCELPPADRLRVDLPESPILVRRRSIANERIEERFFAVAPTDAVLESIDADATLFWRPIDELDGITLTGPHRKWLPQLLAHEVPAPD